MSGKRACKVKPRKRFSYGSISFPRGSRFTYDMAKAGLTALTNTNPVQWAGHSNGLIWYSNNAGSIRSIELLLYQSGKFSIHFGSSSDFLELVLAWRRSNDVPI